MCVCVCVCVRARACNFFATTYKLWPCFCPCELIGGARLHVNVYILMFMSLHLNAHVYSYTFVCVCIFTGGMWRLFHRGSGSGGYYSAGLLLSLFPARYHIHAKSMKNELRARKPFPITSCFPLFHFAMSAHEFDSLLIFRWRLGFSAPTSMESWVLEREAKTVPCQSLFRLLVLEFCCELYGHT